LYSAFNTNTHAWFKNNWNAGTGFTWNPNEISNNALRGGSSLRKPPGMGTWAYLETDGRKIVSFSANVNYARGFGNTVQYEDYTCGINAQPLDPLRFTLAPGYSRSRRKQDQFVTQIDFNGQSRTIVSEVRQQSAYITARLNYNITPNFTI